MPIEHSPKKSGVGIETGNETDESDCIGFEEPEKSSKTTPKSVDPKKATLIKSMSRQREQVMNKLLRMYGALNEQRLIDVAELKVFNTKLHSTYAEYSSFHSQIVAIISDDDVATQEEQYLEFEKFFDWTSAAVETRIQQQTSIKPANPAQVVIHQQPLKAPIPTFDGDYTKWPKFKAMFQDVMAQSRDSSSIKLYHLDKSLVGAAAGVLDAKTINEGNYNQAWKILTERYENQRMIVETHIQGLLTLKKMSTESSKELRNLIDECTNHIGSLQYLAQEVTGVSELMIVYLLTAALDKTTRKLWEQTLKPGELPKYDPTVAFLKSQCQVLERCEACYPTTIPKPTTKFPADKGNYQPTKLTNSTSKPPMVMQRSHAATTKSDDVDKCDICDAAHRNFQCNLLNSLSHAEKTERVRLAGICFNCFRKGHLVKNCSSTKTCRKCQKRHHTQLHEDEIKPKQDSQTSTTPQASKPGTPTTNQNTAQVIQASSSGSTVTTTCSFHTAATPKTVLLLTAIVLVTGKDGSTHNCRALLDSGSQAKFYNRSNGNPSGGGQTTC